MRSTRMMPLRLDSRDWGAAGGFERTMPTTTAIDSAVRYEAALTKSVMLTPTIS